MVNVIINKEDIRNTISEIIERKDVNKLVKYLQVNKIKLNYLNNDFTDILIQSIEKDASIDFIEFIINYGKYKTLNFTIRGNPDYIKKTPLASAIKKNNFKLADYLINYNADINYIPYDILLKSLTKKNSKYIIYKGISITTDLINILIKDNYNFFLKQIFKHVLFDNKFILKFLSFYKIRKPISNYGLKELIEKEKNKITFNKFMYKLALENANYDAISLLYNNDTRERSFVLRDFYNIFENSTKAVKFEFLNKIKSKEINISFEKSNLKDIENIETEEEKKEIIMSFIISSDVKRLQNYIKNKNINLNKIFNKYDYINDILKFSIDNNASIKMLNFIIKQWHYEYFDYYIFEKDIKISLIYYTLLQNKYKIFDFLIKKGADINYGDSLLYFYNNKFLNKKNLRYILNQNYNLTSNTIKLLIVDNKVALMKEIFHQYIFNNFFILKLLSIYNEKSSISDYHLKGIIKEEKNKLNFNSELYKTAIENNNYNAIQCLYDYDTRNKDIILYDIFKLLDNDEKKHQSGRIDIFTNKVKNGQLKLNINEKHLDNFNNIDNKRKVIMEKLKNNDIINLKNYIINNNILLTMFNDEKFDILIYAIEKGVSIEVIKFIVHYYFSLNYYIYDLRERKYKSPLSCAISSNKFLIANLLLENGANINYKIFDSDLIYKLRNEHLLNSSNLKYSLDKGFKITSKLITMLIRNNKNDYLSHILYHFVFDKYFILKLLSFSKNKVSLSSEQLYEIITNEKSKITIKHEWYFEALYYHNNTAVKIFINCDSNKHDLFFDKYELYKLLDKAIYDHNYDFIKELFSSKWFDYKNFNIEEYLSSKRIRYRLDIIDYFIEEILNESFFSFKDASFETLLLNIFEISNITFNFIKRFIQKSFDHKTFDFKYINFENMLKTMVNVREIIEIDKQSYFKLFEILINRSFDHKTFDFKNINFENIISIICKYKFIIEKSFCHNSFDFNKVNFENILSIVSQYKLNLKNTYTYITYLLKLVIGKSFQHPTFNYNTINIQKDIMILRQINDNISVLEYYIEELFNSKNFDINDACVANLILASNKVKNENFEKYIIDKIIKYSTTNFNEKSFICGALFSLGKIKNTYLFEYFINQVIYNKYFKLNYFNIEKILLTATKIKDNSLITYLLNNLLNLIESNKDFNINHINFNKILLLAIKNTNIYIIKYILEKIKNINNTLDVENILKSASRINYIAVMKILIMKIFCVTSLDDIKEYNIVLIKNYSTQSLSLILNALIKLKNFELIKILIEHPELKNKININEKDKNNEYPIIEASHIAKNCYENINIFEYLLENGANCNVKNYNNTSLFIVLIKNENYNVLQYLFKHNILPIIDIDTSNCLLMKAISQNNVDLVKDIINNELRNNENYNRKLLYSHDLSKNFFTPLILSYLLNYQEIFRILLKYYDINEKDYYGYTIIHYSILKDDKETMNQLIYNINQQNENLKIRSVFDIAIKVKKKKIISNLLENDIKNKLINIINEKHETPIVTLSKIDYYSKEEKIEIIKKLISKGIDINAKDLYGKSALIYSIEKNSLTLVKLLVDNGALIFKKMNNNKNIFSSLINIIEICKPDIFEYLLNNCNIKIYMNEIIDIVINNNKQDLLKILIPNYIDSSFMY
ncbi:ankyrin, partial [Piromyces finnis]